MSATSALSASYTTPALSDVLLCSAQHVCAVCAGKSLTVCLERTPAPLRAATQDISFYVMRHLGTARAVQAALVARDTGRPLLDALLWVALALLDAALQADAAPGKKRPRGVPVYAVHTVVHQAVQAAARDLRPYKGMVNGVLRAYVRQRETLKQRLNDDMQARWNFPPWWIQRLQADYPAQWEALLTQTNTPAPMVLRVNRRRQSVAAVLATFHAQGIAAHAVGVAGIVLHTPQPVHALPGFMQGWYSVQDTAAQLAAPLLAPVDGMRVLDACAAPGGKTGHLLELAHLHIQALDKDAQRLQRVRQNLERLGLDGTHVTLTAADASATQTWWDGVPFDAILADVPCTASGIVRRHPDIRWVRRTQDIERTAVLQRRLVDALWPTLRPGGRLLYATCSIFSPECEQQAQAFAQRWPDAQRLPAPGQLLPLDTTDTVQTDGFFYALFVKQR